MTFLDMLRNATAQNQSMLCVGLDPEPSRFPAAMRGDASKISVSYTHLTLPTIYSV